MGQTNYCSRCDRHFNDRTAIKQHYENSNSHFRCSLCNYDSLNQEGLVKHYCKSKHGAYCHGCDNDEGSLWHDFQAYQRHLMEENVCDSCDRHFQSKDNLKQHRTIHLHPTKRCYGCEITFKTYSGMMIHLESGVCESGIGIVDLNKSAAMCYQWTSYLDEDYREDMLSNNNLRHCHNDVVYPFNCVKCDTVFSNLSGLFQHAESSACEQTLEEGKIAKLIRWLEVRHSKDDS